MTYSTLLREGGKGLISLMRKRNLTFQKETLNDKTGRYFQGKNILFRGKSAFCLLKISVLFNAYLHNILGIFVLASPHLLPLLFHLSFTHRPQWGARTYSHTLIVWTYRLRDLLPSRALSAGLTAKGLWPSPTSVGLRPPGLIAFATHCLLDL